MRQGKRGLTVAAQIGLGFGVLIVVTAVLLWVFQIALLGNFYRETRTRLVIRLAEDVSGMLEEEDLDEYVESLSNESGSVIVVCDEMGMQYSGWKPTVRKCLLDNLSRQDRQAIFEQVNLEGGAKVTTYESPFVYSDGSKPQVILYAKVVRTPGGLVRMILVESEITPVGAVVITLREQLIWLTFVMVVLGALLALMIARFIARPIAFINESAKILAGGDYDTRFEESGCREVSELAATLNVAARELSQVEHLRRELLANVSHDLRTPLTMIQGYAEVMRDIPGENSPENAQTIIDEAKRLNELVNDLLDLSRLDNGGVTLQRTPFNLTASVAGILARYDKMMGLTIPFHAAGEVWVTADELKISQVLYNLINNAINYSGEDKRIFVVQSVNAGRVRISVTDNGEGIPADKLQDIWERYYKVDKEHRRAQMGTGLGLAIVKKILDLHGGSYGVESTVGVGSTFWFELGVRSEE